ncbi:MAG: helix-turn-helix domain-containing protein [Pseudodonghicola sp.]|nr:helix-turn-helix domain-containing protein [Pseudodonghicola sp.]
MPRHDLADLIAVAPEVLSRLLKQLEPEGHRIGFPIAPAPQAPRR